MYKIIFRNLIFFIILLCGGCVFDNQVEVVLEFEKISLSIKEIDFLEQDYIVINQTIHFQNYQINNIEEEIILKIIYPNELANEIDYSYYLVEIDDNIVNNSLILSELILNTDNYEKIEEIISSTSYFQIEIYQGEKLLDSKEVELNVLEIE